MKEGLLLITTKPPVSCTDHCFLFVCVADYIYLSGCDENGINCYPLKWKTIFEIYEKAGVSWQVYQDKNNFDDNPLAWFEQYQDAPASSAPASKGMAFLGLDKFYKNAAAGTLPEISFIIGPAELSEHQPYMPKDGAWLQKKVIDSVVNRPKYNSSLLLISYDSMMQFYPSRWPAELQTNLSFRDWWFRRPCQPLSFAGGYAR